MSIASNYLVNIAYKLPISEQKKITKRMDSVAPPEQPKPGTAEQTDTNDK